MGLTPKQQFYQKYKQYLHEQSQLNKSYTDCNPFKLNDCEKLNHVCTDEGKCVPVKKYPLFNQQCYGNLNEDIVCGQLKCFNGQCRNCFDGEYVGNYYCNDGVFKSRASSNYQTVQFWIILTMFLIYGTALTTMLTFCLKKVCKNRQRVKNVRALNQHNEKSE